ncbi:MAG: hypothetical protein GY865_05600 [candidate division Zixibacteria bacterium]|nr:hypothetical protein [candidate division Zixibacteria bacterium]
MKELLIKYYRPIIWSLLIFQLILFAINIPGLYIDIDEPWFGEQAHYLAEDGFVKSEMFQDFLRYDERILVYHKVFIWIGAFSIKFFGLSLFCLRLISLLFGILLTGLLYHFCKRYYNITIFKITLVVLLFCPLIFRNAILYRPEIMICATGFMSFFFLYIFIQNNNKLYLILSAVIAGFSLLIHLNGIIFIGAGAALLLYKKRWTHFGIFSAIAALVASFYFYETIGNFELFGMQFMNDPSNAGGNAQWSMPFTNLLDEHKRLFRKPEIIGITILFLLSAFYWIKNKPTDRKHLLIYTFCLIILMGAINHNKTTKYAILLFPYFALMIAEYIYMLINDSAKQKSLIHKLFLIILSFTILFGSYTTIKLTIFGKENWGEIHRAVASHIPKDSKLLAPMKFMFNEIGNYEIVGFLPAKIILDTRDKDFNAENACLIGLENDVDYIIIDNRYKKEFGCALDDITCLENDYFKYITSEYEYDIYKRDSLLTE